MNTLRASNPRRLVFFGGAILVLSLALIFLARDVIREAIVMPLSYLTWLVGVFVDTSPEMIFWISALFFAGLAAYRSLAGRRKELAPLPPELAEVTSMRGPGGQVSFWALRVRVMRQMPSPYFTSSFHQSVTRLLMDTLAHRNRLTPRQVEDRLREDTLDVPAEVREYALGGLRRFDGEGRPFFADLWTRIAQMVRTLRHNLRYDLLRPAAPQDNGNIRGSETAGRRVSADEEMVRRIVKYLENELEVSNDDTGL